LTGEGKADGKYVFLVFIYIASKTYYLPPLSVVWTVIPCGLWQLKELSYKEI